MLNFIIVGSSQSIKFNKHFEFVGFISCICSLSDSSPISTTKRPSFESIEDDRPLFKLFILLDVVVKIIGLFSFSIAIPLLSAKRLR